VSDTDDRAARHREHAPSAIARRLSRTADRSYLRDAVFGAVDGAVTTFAVVAGAIGASLPGGIVVILGMANLFADGLSMAVGNFLGTRAEAQRRDEIRAEEYRQIEEIPDGEREEIRQIFRAKGFEGDLLERVVEVITENPERWVDTMLTDEHGLNLEGPQAGRAALWTFGAFLAAGIVPIAPFILKAAGWDSLAAFQVSIVLTAATFFVVGAIKGRVVNRSWLRDGVETLALGGVAAIAAFAAGWLLRGLAEGI
jgi:VIT1/CCC1 family predicted Fe2+/Mn2+ transporter